MGEQHRLARAVLEGAYDTFIDNVRNVSIDEALDAAGGFRSILGLVTRARSTRPWGFAGGEAWEYGEEVEENHISTLGHRVRRPWITDGEAARHEAT
jgi:hypothetical protein